MLEVKNGTKFLSLLLSNIVGPTLSLTRNLGVRQSIDLHTCTVYAHIFVVLLSLICTFLLCCFKNTSAPWPRKSAFDLCYWLCCFLVSPWSSLKLFVMACPWSLFEFSPREFLSDGFFLSTLSHWHSLSLPPSLSLSVCLVIAMEKLIRVSRFLFAENPTALGRGGASFSTKLFFFFFALLIRVLRVLCLFGEKFASRFWLIFGSQWSVPSPFSHNSTAKRAEGSWIEDASSSLWNVMGFRASWRGEAILVRLWTIQFATSNCVA